MRVFRIEHADMLERHYRIMISLLNRQLDLGKINNKDAKEFINELDSLYSDIRSILVIRDTDHGTRPHKASN